MLLRTAKMQMITAKLQLRTAKLQYPLAFVDALHQVFGPMTSRMKVAILDAHIVQTPALLLKALSRYRISHVTLK